MILLDYLLLIDQAVFNTSKTSAYQHLVLLWNLSNQCTSFSWSSLSLSSISLLYLCDIMKQRNLRGTSMFMVWLKTSLFFYPYDFVDYESDNIKWLVIKQELATRLETLSCITIQLLLQFLMSILLPFQSDPLRIHREALHILGLFVWLNQPLWWKWQNQKD